MFKKIDDKGDECMSLEDKRDKFSKNHPNKILEKVKMTVREHVGQIHFVESHYLRENAVRKYFEQHLTFTRLYTLYEKWLNTRILQKR